VEKPVSSRDAVLLAVRTALGPAVEAPEVPRRYRGSGTGAGANVVELFCERVADYKAKVNRVVKPDELPEALAAACADRGSRSVLRSPGAEWTIAGMELGEDSPELSPQDLDRVDAALTGCALAIAETGTIVLDGGPMSGRRALTLVPDHHMCVVRADQVVANLPDAIAALGDAARTGSPLTFVSGPSATSDIELERVEGVHGPRKLDVMVVGSGG
jgi:L-lactate dehydrogenase complex protein LldG